MGKDRPRALQGDDLAEKFGNYDAAGPPSRERSKGEQGERRDTYLAEAVARAVSVDTRTVGVKSACAGGREGGENAQVWGHRI